MTFTNPVYPGYFADPFLFRHAGLYYAVGTGREDVFPMLRSPDLRQWEPLGSALAPVDSRHGTTYWAPEVAYHEGMFFLYYSVGFADKYHQLRVALSEVPEGPYRDAGEALLSPPDCPFAIDPHPFRDDDGRWYLFYATDFLDGEGGCRPGTALKVARLRTMTRLEGAGETVLRARFDWQRFQKDRPMYGRVYDWHTLEGPAVRKRGDRYYLFFSGGRWENETYGVDYAVADHVTGPYRAESPGGPRVLRTEPGHVIGPGHNSFVVAPDGSTELIAYHAWDPAMTARRLCLDPIRWTESGPRVGRAT